MRAYHPDRAAHAFAGEVEALLVHERTIVPQVAIVRARALARAREALRSGVVLAWENASAPRRWTRLQLAGAAAVVFLASTAAAFQLGINLAPPPSSAHPASLQHFAQATTPPAATEPAPPKAAKPPAVAHPAPMAGGAPGKATSASRPASQPAKEEIVLEELRLLERAQQLANRGDYVTVLGIAADHERRYPAGHLCEEREALRLRALVALGRNQEARQVAARFRRDYPHSVLLPKLSDLLAASP
jgi:hypothetical protein